VPFRDPPTPLPRASGFADAKESFLALSASFAVHRKGSSAPLNGGNLQPTAVANLFDVGL